jgi:hypothetical protein
MANRKKSLDLEKMKKRIIKILNSKNNPDGFLESFLMEDLVYVKKENEFQENHFQYLKRNLEHVPQLVDYLETVYDELSYTAFKKFFKNLIQENIKKKVLSGKATYDYIFGIAPYASNSWVLPEYTSFEATRQIKALHFYQYIDEMLRPNCFFTARQRNKFLNEYLEVAKYPKDVIVKFFKDPQNTINSEIEDDDFEGVLKRALKYSF